MKLWYVFPPDVTDTCVAAHDTAGWTLTAQPAKHPSNGADCQAFQVPDNTSDGNGCSLQVTNAKGIALYKKPIHGVLYLNLPTGVGLLVDVLPEVSGSGASGQAPRIDVRLSGRTWSDLTGRFFPLGETMMYGVEHVSRGRIDQIVQNYKYLKENGVDFVRTAGQLDWVGQELDPFRLEYPTWLAQTLELAYAHGLLTHLFAIGGKCQDPVAAARIMMSVIMNGRRHMVILGEATNEDKALSQQEAIDVARVLAPLGTFCIGMGNTDIQNNIIPGDQAVSAPISTLHSERTPPEARMVRQCWDFHLFHPRAGLSGEPPGTGSSVGQMNDPFSHASLRAGEIICGATMHVHHCGSGVTGNDEPNPYGQRFALLSQSPQHTEQLRALVNAVKQLPSDIGDWSTRFNNNQPVDIPAGNVEKLYGGTDGNRFAEIAIDAAGPVTFRARWACHLRIVNPAEDVLLFDGDLTTGQTTTVNGLQHYVLVGERA